MRARNGYIIQPEVELTPFENTLSNGFWLSSGDYNFLTELTLAASNTVSFYWQALTTETLTAFTYYTQTGSSGGHQITYQVYEVSPYTFGRVGSSYLAEYANKVPSSSTNNYVVEYLTSPTSGSQPRCVKGRWYEISCSLASGTPGITTFRNSSSMYPCMLQAWVPSGSIKTIDICANAGIMYSGSGVQAYYGGALSTTVTNIVDTASAVLRGFWQIYTEPLLLMGFVSVGERSGTGTLPTAYIPKVYHYTSSDFTTWTLDSGFPNCQFTPISSGTSRIMTTALLNGSTFYLTPGIYHGFVVGTTTPLSSATANCIGLHDLFTSANAIPFKNKAIWTPSLILNKLKQGPLGTANGGTTWLTDGSLAVPQLSPIMGPTTLPLVTG